MSDNWGNNYQHVHLTSTSSVRSDKYQFVITVCLICSFCRFFEGANNQPIYLDDLQCSGTEFLLINCPHNGIGNHNCAHFEDVGLQCLFSGGSTTAFSTFPTSPPTQEFCFEGQFQQVFDSSSNFTSYQENGQFYSVFDIPIRFCNNGFYASLCDLDWDDNDAGVLCRDFGYIGYGKLLSTYNINY